MIIKILIFLIMFIPHTKGSKMINDLIMKEIDKIELKSN